MAQRCETGRIARHVDNVRCIIYMRQVCAMAMFNFMRDAVFFREIPGVRTQFVRAGLHDLHQDDVRQVRR